jgi:hypothetical protein
VRRSRIGLCLFVFGEYEAELIQVRRKAGAYGSRHRRQAYAAFAFAATAIVAALFIL